MVKTVAYLIEDVANPRNRQRFGIDALLAQGIQVHVIELSGLTFPEVPRDRACYHDPLPFRLDVVSDWSGLARVAPSLAGADTIISLISTGALDPRSIPVYRAIARSGRPYMVISSNAFPGFGGGGGGLSLGQRLKAFRPLHSLTARLDPAWLGIPKAAWVVHGGEKSKIPNRFVGPRTREVWAHAMDYEAALPEMGQPERLIAVFLDEYHPFHPDVIGMGGTHPTPPDYYYARLRELFDRIEAELGLEVVIAACPRAEYDDKPGLFGTRTVLKHATARLVAESRLVLAHRSTAIAFAIIFEKPVMQVAHRTSYEAPEQKPYFDSFAEILGKPIRFIDDPAAVDLSGALDFDRARYGQYMRDYVKRPGSPERPYWSIVLDAVATQDSPPVMTKASPWFHAADWPAEEAMNSNQRRLVAEFNRDLEAGTLPTERVPCLCGGTRFERIASYDRYRIRQDTVVCRDCGLVQLMPRLTGEAYGRFYGSDLYRKLYNPELMGIDTAAYERAVDKNRYRFDFVAATVGLDGIASVLEVGCGGGWNLMPFHRAGKSVRGYDLGPSLIAFGRTQGLDLRPGTFSDVREGGFDLIVLSHVVEHLLDPAAEIARLLPRLNQGGHFYIEVPDMDSFALGGLQNAHTYWFTERTLGHLLAGIGLESVAARRFGCHLGMVLRPAASPAKPPLDGEYSRIRALVGDYDRRQRLKHWLRRLGLLKLLGRG